MKDLSWKNLNNEACRDSGIALAILLLLVDLWVPMFSATLWAVVVLFLASLQPIIFKPFAWIWFKFSMLIGHLMSWVITGFVFFTVLSFFALLRRMLRHDTLMIRSTIPKNISVFKARNKIFDANDLKRSF